MTQDSVAPSFFFRSLDKHWETRAVSCTRTYVPPSEEKGARVTSVRVLGLAEEKENGVVEWAGETAERPRFVLNCSLAPQDSFYLVMFDGDKELRYLVSGNDKQAYKDKVVTHVKKRDLTFMRKVVAGWLETR